MREARRFATVGRLRQTVLIVDDHGAFRAAAHALLEASAFDVVGEAADGASALAAVAEVSPDIVLLDIQLPDLDGFAVAERLADDHAPLAIVLTSSRSANCADRRGRLERRHLEEAVPQPEDGRDARPPHPPQARNRRERGLPPPRARGARAPPRLNRAVRTPKYRYSVPGTYL